MPPAWSIVRVETTPGGQGLPHRGISKADASFRSLGDPLWDTGSSHGRLLSTMLAAIAEFQRELIRERTREGRGRAQALQPRRPM
jgi:hypothetical protein